MRAVWIYEVARSNAKKGRNHSFSFIGINMYLQNSQQKLNKENISRKLGLLARKTVSQRRERKLLHISKPK